MNGRALGLMLGAALAPVAAAGYTLPASGPPAPLASFADADAYLDYVGRSTFGFFLANQNPVTGLFPDRASNPGVCSIASVGFGLACIPVAVDHGWITRAKGAAMAQKTLDFLVGAPQGPGASGFSGYRGWFYHFLDSGTGLRTWTSELSTGDTSLLMWGVHACGLYFDAPGDPVETDIRSASASLLSAVDWAFMVRSDNTVCMAWTPESGYASSAWTGYCEAMSLYLLGLGASGTPLPSASWPAWTSTYRQSTYAGLTYVSINDASLFAYQFTHDFVDFRGITDPYFRANLPGQDYFLNSSSATLAQQAYAETKPFGNYGELEFGITACDGPAATILGVAYQGYAARGAPFGQLDDGTLSPTAVLASLPFAPWACLPASEAVYARYGGLVFSDYGFCDAYNETASAWFDPDVVGIDAGNAVLGIDAYLGGRFQDLMLTSSILQRGLQRAGFEAPPPDVLSAQPQADGRLLVSWNVRSSFATATQIETSADGASFGTAAVVPAPQSQALVPGPTPGSALFVRARSQSANGTSGFLNTVLVQAPVQPPAGQSGGPAVTRAPTSESVAVGAAVTLEVAATAAGALSYQWSHDGQAIPGATAPSYTVADAQVSDTGGYTVSVTGPGGATQCGALLAVGHASGPPSIEQEPVSQTVEWGGSVAFRVGSGGVVLPGASAPIPAGAPSYQWYHDGALLPGATAPTLLIRGVTAASAGSYACIVSNPSGAVLTTAAVLAVAGTADAGRLVDVSCRAEVGTGSDVLIAGFVVGGAGTTGALPVLVRSSGPSLAAFGVGGFLKDPQLQLFPGGSSVPIASDSGWDGDAQVALLAANVGAFAWTDPGSLDSALVRTLPGGPYSAVTSGGSADTGVALVEVYDATAPAAYGAGLSPRLTNLSTRVRVGTGSGVLIAGFVVGGSTSETLLIRASGPALAQFGIGGLLPDPKLQLFGSGSSTTPIASNQAWGGDPQVAAAASAVGAFDWNDPASKDCALLVTLAPGAYTAVVSGAAGDEGVALVEVYEVP